MRQGWFCGKEERTGKTIVASMLMVLLLIVIGFTTLPKVNAQTPYVLGIVSGARNWPGLPGGISLTEPDGVTPFANTYDAGSGSLGPFVVDHPLSSPQVATATYTITITWTGTFDPVVVGGFGDIAAGQFFWSVIGNTLTIIVQSVGVVVPPFGTVYFLGVQVFFSTSALSEQNGVAVCFQAGNFKVSEGERPGILVITVTGYTGQTTGFFKLFIPASVPAQFGRTLDDVVITLDGSAVVGATTADTSFIVSKGGVGVPGRLWTFNIAFSERTVKSDPNPQAPPVGGYPVAVNKLSIAAPFLALAALVVLVSTVFAMRRRRA